MEAAAAWALFGTGVNVAVSLLLTGASMRRPTRWLIHATVASWCFALADAIIAVILNQTRLGLPPDRETLLQLVVVVVVVFSIPPLWWLATLSLTWWRERGA